MQNRRNFTKNIISIGLTGEAVKSGLLLANNDKSSESGAVFSISNDIAENRLLIFRRYPNGLLTAFNSISTGGTGTGSNLGSQGALGINRARNIVFAVNPGSDSISSFYMSKNGPVLLQEIDSGGAQPVSLSVGHRFVYVLNNGAKKGKTDQISGFSFNPSNLRLTPIESSIRELSEENVSPAQISFDPEQKQLLVTEKTTNLIDVFPVNADGTTGVVNEQTSSGRRPFGFGFSQKNKVIVSEAGTDSTSSYILDNVNSKLTVVSPCVPNGGPGACWVSVTQDGRFAYVSNFSSSVITGFKITTASNLVALNGNKFATPTAGNPIDSAIAGNRFFYVLSHFQNKYTVLAAYQIQIDGGLRPIGQISGLPLSMVGLVAI